ncbi:MAG TPA: arylesterase [Candidatus Sulfomarinibacteraceae bacterium]|nr:arylesterase [Candidatus Sulfomarinibacteraceae bacterium]
MAKIISRAGRFRSPAVLSVALALWATACAGPEPAPTAVVPTPVATASPAAVRIVVLGDSLAAGLGLPAVEAFPAVVESLLRERGHAVEVVNAGVSGDTTAGGLARLDWVLQQPADILVVELGGNDALRGQDLEATESNLRAIVRRGRAAGARVLLLGMDVPSNYGPDYGSRFAALYERLAEEEKVQLVPGFVREVGSDPTLLQPDGLHPTAEGQQRLAETLLPHLEALLPEAPSIAGPP